MTPTTAAELKAGDVFCREGRPDTPYLVLAVKPVPIYGFFGNLYETVEVTVQHPLTGRAPMNLSLDEPVWLLPEAAVSSPPGPSAGGRWRRRRKRSGAN